MNPNNKDFEDVDINLDEINISEMMGKIKNVVAENKDLIELVNKMEKDFKTSIENLENSNIMNNIELLKKWR